MGRRRIQPLKRLTVIQNDSLLVESEGNEYLVADPSRIICMSNELNGDLKEMLKEELIVELKEMFKEYKNNSKNINGTQIKKKT
jgi:hypothetical protein